MKSIGMLYGPYDQLIDHIVPLCHMKGLPLVVTEPEIEALIAQHYPFTDTHRLTYTALPYKVLESFDQIVAPMSKLLVQEIFFLAQELQGKQLHSIWTPHGNSDKGYASTLRTFVENETTALVYGQKMIDFFMKNFKFSLHDNSYFDGALNDNPNSPKLAHLGNYRLKYYMDHKDHFDAIIDRTLPSGKTTILYAPTWCWETELPSHLEQMHTLIEHLTPHYNLIIKIHPRTRRGDPHLIDKFIADHKTAYFLNEFPLIYPLLARCDIYIGDISSIGYDFLAFNRPMIFIHDHSLPPEERYLQQCGTTITKTDLPNINRHIEAAFTSDSHSSIRKKIYNYTFK